VMRARAIIGAGFESVMSRGPRTGIREPYLAPIRPWDHHLAGMPASRLPYRYVSLAKAMAGTEKIPLL